MAFALAMAEACAILEELGMTHNDIKPAHFLTIDRVGLIDPVGEHPLQGRSGYVCACLTPDYAGV